MMRHLAIACLIYLALVLQPHLESDLNLGSFRPWLPGIVLVASVVMAEGAASLVWAGLLGLGVDCLSVERLGVHVVIATIVAAALMLARDDGRSRGVILVGSFVFGGTFLWRSLAAIAHGILDRRSIDLAAVTESSLEIAIGSAGIVVVLLSTGQFLLMLITPHRRSTFQLANRWSMLTGR